MAEKKILLKEVYEKLLSDAYAEKNDELLPVVKYDGKIVKKIEKLITIDAQDYEAAIDSKDSKNYYDTYLKIFYGIIKCENEKDLGEWKDPIIENNPWKEALKTSNKFRSIADSDYKIMERIIDVESDSIFERLFNENLSKLFKDSFHNLYERNPDLQSTVKTELGYKFFEKVFADFEHAFDGNFENPRVIILGINPRLKDFNHESYNLAEVYDKPFDSKRPTLYSEGDKCSKDEYYFTPNGFFFIDSKNSKTNKVIKTSHKIKREFLQQITSKSKDTPYALWEFFPYATNSENEWCEGVKILDGPNSIKEYLSLSRWMPSQIWLLCLLTYTLKKSSPYIFLTKNNDDFRKKFFDNYLDTLEITKDSKIKVLSKLNGRNRRFNLTNIKNYFKNGEEISFESVEEFFKEIWAIPEDTETPVD